MSRLPSSDNCQPHIAVLAICSAMLGAALVLAWVGHVDGALKIGSISIPSACTFKSVTGLPCAGCGLTRSWVALAGGDLQISLAYHRFGWLVMFYVVAQTTRHGLWLAAAALRPAVERAGWWLDRAILVVAALLLVDWASFLLGVFC